MSGTLKSNSPLDGGQAKCYITSEDGEVIDLLYAKNVEATVKKNKSKIKVLGYRGAKNKATGWEGTGKMTVYYQSSYFRKKMIDYIKNGKDFYFTTAIENCDIASEIGRQSVLLKKCNIDDVCMAKLDVDNTELEEEFSFTFEDVEILEEFTEPIGE